MSTWKHAMADLETGVRLHYVSAGQGERTVVLLHGFPQTWWSWRQIIMPLADRGFRVIAPDYRGAGHSTRPPGGYDKCTMAKDIHCLVRDHLKIPSPVILAGHDIGMMVAYAYAQEWREEVSHLIMLDSPLPGTEMFEKLRVNPRIWQFSFHSVPDIPEMLVAGRERQYLQAFYNARIFNAGAITEEDLDLYASAYAAAGAMRAAFNLYRAFDQDVADNRAALARAGKLDIPVLSIGGAASTTGPVLESMIREVANNVRGILMQEAAHWIAEENPEGTLAAITDFVDKPMR
jgi:pimeloyl-ACP methyl ester carboxylesterase